MSSTDLSIDYYEILGVTEDASEAEIKAAYRRLAQEWNNDKPELQGSREAHEKLTLINLAHEVLGDPDKKSQYDRERSNARQRCRPRPDPQIVDFGNIDKGRTVATIAVEVLTDPPGSWPDELQLLDCGIGQTEGEFWRVQTLPPTGEDEGDVFITLIFEAIPQPRDEKTFRDLCVGEALCERAQSPKRPTAETQNSRATKTLGASSRLSCWQLRTPRNY